tara:strand:- start:240 stop:611 length:372 start_codon:yes stop_codon:yes gene_type:complete
MDGVFKYTDAVSNSNKVAKPPNTIISSAKTNPKQTWTGCLAGRSSSHKSSSKQSFSSENMHKPILSIDPIDPNETINIDTKQVYVNYFINKNWDNINNYLPFYEIELLEEDGETEYENDLCDY